MSQTDSQVASVLTACFHKKMIGLVLCEVLVACNSLKTMTTDKIYQRINYYCMLIYTEFNLAHYQKLLVKFWFRKTRTTYDNTRLIYMCIYIYIYIHTQQRQNVKKAALFALLN